MTTRRILPGSTLVVASAAVLPRFALAGIALTERDRVARDLQAFVAS